MKYNDEVILSIKALSQEGFSSRFIADILGISKSGVNNVLAYLNDGPRILYFDLESTPSIAATFKRFNTNITPAQVIQEGGWLLSAAWSWENDYTIYGKAITPSAAKAQDDLEVVYEMYNQIDQADIVVAHNGAKFDLPLLKARLIKNKLQPLKSVKLVDTLAIAKTLKFESNKLDSLCHYLDIGRKESTTGISMWLKCMEGDKDALERMLKYNMQDIHLLKELYYLVRPYHKNGPNYGQYYNDGKIHCPACGDTNLIVTGNTVYCGNNEYEEYVCNGCGHRSRSRNGLTSKEQRSMLLAHAG